MARAERSEEPRVEVLPLSSVTLPEITRTGWTAPVITMFVDLDPSSFGTPNARRTQIDSLVIQASKLIESGGLRGDEARRLRGAVQRVQDYLVRDGEWVKNAAGVVVVWDGTDTALKVVKLPSTVRPKVFIEAGPRVESLTISALPEGWCIALVNRQSARVFVGTAKDLQEIARIDDAVHRRHDQGGWSQARYQRSIEESVGDHVKHVCDELFKLFRGLGFQKLVIGAADELWPDIERHLHSYLRERLVHHFETEVEHISVEHVAEKLSAVIAAHDSHIVARLLEELAEKNRKGLAVAGIDDVLNALYERRVANLLVADGFEVSGMVCRECRWATVGSAPRCPVDSRGLTPAPNVVSHAIESALLQSAIVNSLNEAQLPASVAAILRY